MGKSQRVKGTRYERDTVIALKGLGIAAQRVPLSGASAFTGNHDVTVPLLGRDLTAECKVGAQVPKTPYAWLADHDLAFLRRDREETLVLMPWRVWEEITRNLK